MDVDVSVVDEVDHTLHHGVFVNGECSCLGDGDEGGEGIGGRGDVTLSIAALEGLGLYGGGGIDSNRRAVELAVFCRLGFIEGVVDGGAFGGAADADCLGLEISSSGRAEGRGGHGLLTAASAICYGDCLDTAVARSASNSKGHFRSLTGPCRRRKRTCLSGDGVGAVTRAKAEGDGTDCAVRGNNKIVPGIGSHGCARVVILGPVASRALVEHNADIVINIDDDAVKILGVRIPLLREVDGGFRSHLSP